MSKNFKKKDILERVKSLEAEITKATEYLETGTHANWHGFKPVFNPKIKDGKELPPHKDWVKNVFLPSREKALNKAEKLLDKFE
ncbi:MAG: hypothetical protein ACRBHB_02295 [Arenicella sp.]